jgi:hypothetical protein
MLNKNLGYKINDKFQFKDEFKDEFTNNFLKYLSDYKKYNKDDNVVEEISIIYNDNKLYINITLNDNKCLIKIFTYENIQSSIDNIKSCLSLDLPLDSSLINNIESYKIISYYFIDYYVNTIPNNFILSTKDNELIINFLINCYSDKEKSKSSFKIIFTTELYLNGILNGLLNYQSSYYNHIFNYINKSIDTFKTISEDINNFTETTQQGGNKISPDIRKKFLVDILISMNDKKILINYYIDKNINEKELSNNDENITKISLLFYGIEEKSIEEIDELIKDANIFKQIALNTNSEYDFYIDAIESIKLSKNKLFLNEIYNNLNIQNIINHCNINSNKNIMTPYYNIYYNILIDFNNNNNNNNTNFYYKINIPDRNSYEQVLYNYFNTNINILSKNIKKFDIYKNINSKNFKFIINPKNMYLIINNANNIILDSIFIYKLLKFPINLVQEYFTLPNYLVVFYKKLTLNNKKLTLNNINNNYYTNIIQYIKKIDSKTNKVKIDFLNDDQFNKIKDKKDLYYFLYGYLNIYTRDLFNLYLENIKYIKKKNISIYLSVISKRDNKFNILINIVKPLKLFHYKARQIDIELDEFKKFYMIYNLYTKEENINIIKNNSNLTSKNIKEIDDNFFILKWILRYNKIKDIYINLYKNIIENLKFKEYKIPKQQSKSANSQQNLKISTSANPQQNLKINTSAISQQNQQQQLQQQLQQNTNKCNFEKLKEHFNQSDKLNNSTYYFINNNDNLVVINYKTGNISNELTSLLNCDNNQLISFIKKFILKLLKYKDDIVEIQLKKIKNIKNIIYIIIYYKSNTINFIKKNQKLTDNNPFFKINIDKMSYLYQQYRPRIMNSKNFVSIKEVLNDIISSIEKSKINKLNKLNIRRVERLNKRNNSILLYEIIKENNKYILKDKNNRYDNENINKEKFKDFYDNIMNKNIQKNITGIYLEENDTYIRIYYKSKEYLSKGNKPYLKININNILDDKNNFIIKKTFEDLKKYIKNPKNSNSKNTSLNVHYIPHNSMFNKN